MFFMSFIFFFCYFFYRVIRFYYYISLVFFIYLLSLELIFIAITLMVACINFSLGVLFWFFFYIYFTFYSCLLRRRWVYLYFVLFVNGTSSVSLDRLLLLKSLKLLGQLKRDLFFLNDMYTLLRGVA